MKFSADSTCREEMKLRLHERLGCVRSTWLVFWKFWGVIVGTRSDHTKILNSERVGVGILNWKLCLKCTRLVSASAAALFRALGSSKCWFCWFFCSSIWWLQNSYHEVSRERTLIFNAGHIPLLARVRSSHAIF